MENLTNNTGLQFFNASGVRQPKAVNENVIIAESTRASFKLMPAVCAKLGVADGDYVTMQLTKDESGVVTGVYIGKGKNATYELDSNGNIVLDDRKRKVVVEGKEGFGALASEQQAGTNVLKISVASAWDAIGDADLKKHYKLSDEAVTISLPIGDGESHTTDLYKLEFVKDEPKVERAPAKKKEDADVPAENVEGTINATETPGNDYQMQATPEQAFGETSSDDNDEF